MPVWFIGRDREWYVPAEPGVVNRVSQLRYEILIDNLGVRVGSSGAPLLAADGIVGMVVRDAAADAASATLITAIELAFREWGFPWGLAPVGSLEQKAMAAVPEEPKGKTDRGRNATETARAAGEITDCDRLAAHPADPHALAPGVSLDKINQAKAVPACQESVERFPEVARYEFQYGRALVKADRAEEALKWFRRAAERDYTAAWNALGNLYTNGIGTAKDDAAAVTWFRKAGDRGHALSQTTLGDMYAKGLGVTRDDGEAVHWFRKAAEQDNAAAEGRLGAMYAQGFGVAQDDSEALQWLRKSAAQNDFTAKHGSGTCTPRVVGQPRISVKLNGG